MDLVDRLRELAARVPRLKEQGLVTTEEGAKNALIMPFIQALGYDVFDPSIVTPELTADVGTKRGEKVDYAILQDGHPIILIECKGLDADLSKAHASQLYRYFSVTEARFGVLTNGVTYMFFSDLEEPNKMDDHPFFIFDLMDFPDQAVESLKQFSRSAFDQERIIATASELKYKRAIKQAIADQFANPSEELVRLLFRDVYTGRFTQSVLDEFTVFTKETLRSYVNDQVEKRLKSALATDTATVQQVAGDEIDEVATEEPWTKSDVVTTQEELDAFYAIKGIVRDVIDVSRVSMRDAKTYCGILIDDNNRKPLCRLHFNTTQKYLGLLDEDKNETRTPINAIDDIFHFADQLKAAAQKYLES